MLDNQGGPWAIARLSLSAQIIPWGRGVFSRLDVIIICRVVNYWLHYLCSNRHDCRINRYVFQIGSAWFPSVYITDLTPSNVTHLLTCSAFISSNCWSCCLFSNQRSQKTKEFISSLNPFGLFEFGDQTHINCQLNGFCWVANQDIAKLDCFCQLDSYWCLRLFLLYKSK